jgi:predicted deacylase
VHGAEYCSVAAVRSLVASLETSTLRGRVRAVPVANMSSFWTRVPFVIPADGKNLNRVFPGDPNGTYSEVLAHHLFERFVRGSDFLVHVHGGSTMEYIEPFVGYDSTDATSVTPDVEARSREMAVAYGLRYVLRTERVDEGGPQTMLRTAAAESGIPALLTEAGDQGLLDQAAVDLHVRGLRRVLQQLELLPGGAPEPVAEQVVVNSLVPVTADRDSWWEPTVRAGDVVCEGDDLGALRDLFGREMSHALAPAAGVCLVLTTSPAAKAGSVLAYIGAETEPLAGE